VDTELNRPQYITDEKGRKTAVILSLDACNELFEDLSDLAAVAERRDEPTIPLFKLVDSLKADGLLWHRMEGLGRQGTTETPWFGEYLSDPRRRVMLHAQHL
jgi:hypothetical protein